MGVKIIVHIRHIRGHSFDIEVDRDADCVGLKVAIWDAQKIAVETQRLVYAGKEIGDESNLVELGIDDGSTIFLVEKVEEVNSVMVQPQAVEVMPVPEHSVSNSVTVEPMSVQHYAELTEDRSHEERIRFVVGLAFWVRIYCIFGVVISVIGLTHCWLSVIPLLCCLIGYFATRKLNRCGLIFPFLLSIVVGPIGFVFVLSRLATHVRACLIVALLASFFHIFIMAGIGKLRCRIWHLSPQEKQEAVDRIRRSIRCC